MNRLIRCAPLAFGLLAACQPNQKTDQTAATTATAPTAKPTASAAPADSPGASYRQYRGRLAGAADSITLDLMTAPRLTNDVVMAGSFGSYYGPDGHPYQLASLPSATPDSVLLFDVSPDVADNQREGANWRLLRQGETLTGTHNGQPVRLRGVRPAVRLAVRYLADSVVAFPGVKKSPAAHITLQTLVASAAPDALNINILRDLRGDTLANQPAPQLTQLWAQQLARYQKTYREDAAASRDNPRGASDDLPFGYGLRYDEQQSTYVLWNQAPYLSLGFYSYSYTGGAHGNYGTATATYDTRTGQRLRYNDIFRPGSEAQLSKLLEKAARRTLRIAPTDPLDGTLFVKTMPVTHNVYLTGGGAVFTYTPYEIASYAQGEIPLFIPLAELQPLLKSQPAS